MRSSSMEYPFDKDTFWGIGEFHVGGHVERCFARHSPQFIPGAGMVDGEILETLWSVLNEVSPSTQTATLASRTEMLDDHMLDSNWKKLLGIGRYLMCSCLGFAEDSVQYHPSAGSIWPV